MTRHHRTLLFTLFLLTSAETTIAGNLDPPSGPTDPASAMYTVTDLYNRLTAGSAGAKRSGPFVEPTAAPAPTGYTTDQIMAAMPTADNANGATAAEVVGGKTFWGLRTDGTWGQKVGAMPLQTLNPASPTVAAGYYAAINLATVDPDMVTGNIKAGVSIFGVNGKPQVVDTTEAASPVSAGQILAGRKAFVNGAAVTGTITAGANVTGPNGALVLTIPDGMYTGGKTATTTDASLVSGNVRSGITIFGVAGNPNVVNTGSGTALAGDIMTGKKAWIAGTEVTGTLPTQTLNPASTTIPSGYYAATNLATVDPDLATANIRAGVAIFGVNGDPNVVNTSSATVTSTDILIGKKAWGNGTEITGTRYPIPVGQTGQVTCYNSGGTPVSCAGTGQDGDWRNKKGIDMPNPRFSDNNNGTVTDNATGLIWLKDANCFTALSWQSALDAANSLAHGTCSLSDGSTAGQWRLPNLRELLSLVDWERTMPALPINHPFINVMYDAGDASPYWSATTSIGALNAAWYIKWNHGHSLYVGKTVGSFVWPVRGGM